MKGHIICLTGIDGCGKSTQLEKLAEWFREQKIPSALIKMSPRKREHYSIYHDVKYNLLAEGKEMPADIRAIILAFDSYVQICTEVIPLLEKGYIVLCDRYVESTDLYLAARGINNYWPNQILKYAPKADLTLYISNSVDNCMARIKERGGHIQSHENEKMLLKIKECFESKYAKEKYSLVKIDGSGSIESTYDQIIEIVQKVVLRWKNE